MWPDRRVIELFKIEHPILLAPMAGPSTAELTIAVSEAGGLGAFGCALASPDRIRIRTWCGPPAYRQTDKSEFLRTYAARTRCRARGGLAAAARRLLFWSSASIPENLPADEPTNDLDVDMFRALEEALLNFAGARGHQPRSLVSPPHRHAHDRVRRRQPGRLVRRQLSGLRGRPQTLVVWAPPPISRTGSSIES